jgi:hypothetical protein
MSPGYDGCQTATLPICYTRTTYATTSYYTKAPEYYTTRYAAPAYYTESPKYYSAPSYTNKALEYFTEAG